jgi:exopolysaccharide biosynthesis polyprenyl glycosylphosphotransferase
MLDVRSHSQKRRTLPQYRYAIRTAAILIAIVGDILLIAAAAPTATFIRFRNFSDTTTLDLLLIIVPAFLLAAVALDCYSINTLRHSFRSIGRVLLALAIAAGLAFATAFALQVGSIYSRLETGLMLVTAAAYLIIGRVLYKVWLDRLAGVIDPRVLVLGPDPGVIDVAGGVDHVVPSERPNPADPNSLERTYALIRHADRIILAFDDATERAAWARFVRLIGIGAELFEPDLQNITVLGVNHWQGTPTLIVSRGALNFGERAIKRIFDLSMSVALLALVGPWLLLLMLLIKLDSPGPAIFAQPRVGRNNRRYQCYKLRTMYAEVTDPHGHRSTGRDDDRITRIGRFLRRTSLDEFPQLWNVIRGNMSLVGPRPHALGSTAEGALFWEAVPDYWTRHAMRPGITGLAQVRGLRGATHTRSDIEKRVTADLEYINSWSIWLDLKISLQTIRVVYHQNAF